MININKCGWEGESYQALHDINIIFHVKFVINKFKTLFERERGLNTITEVLI